MAACSTRAHSIGVSVSDTKPETMIATEIVTANSRNTRPTMPPISSTGMNTAISENVIETMVKPISREPFSAASNGRMPSSMWRTMFSSMTMASSTTKPTDSVSASSVMLLMEKPNAYIAAQVPISETGTASAGNDGRRHLAQEQEDHQDHERDRDHQRLLHVADRLRGSRSSGRSAAASGSRAAPARAYAGSLVAHAIDHRDRIGVGLALDREHDRALVVEPAGDLVVLDAVDDARDLARA